MSKIEKINLNDIRGKYQETSFIDGNPNLPRISGGDDTIESIKMVAQKLNEVIDLLQKEEKGIIDHEFKSAYLTELCKFCGENVVNAVYLSAPHHWGANSVFSGT